MEELKGSESEWKDYYNMFRTSAEELYSMPELPTSLTFPEFTEDEVALLDTICKTDSHFEYLLESFYNRLCELVMFLKEEGRIVKTVRFHHLLEIGSFWGSIREKLSNLIFKESRWDIKEIIDSILDKMSSTLVDVSIVLGHMRESR